MSDRGRVAGLRSPCPPIAGEGARTMSTSRRRPNRLHAWSRPWSWVQLISHIAVVLALGCFFALCHNDWRAAGGLREALLIPFYVVCVGTALLYFYVCMADTKYRETPLDLMVDDCEPRLCEDCDTHISHLRVKHCHICGKCVRDFDHHCRYLNSCIGGRIHYRAWAVFVLGLLLLMATCTVAASLSLVKDEATMLDWFSLGLMMVVSLVLTLFLAALLSQHIYLACEGITTLEYVKSQPPGFPGLPEQGWRNAVKANACYGCGDGLELIEVDKDECWFCTVCQVDLAKAGVPFLTCEGCQEVNVCVPCRRVAVRPDREVVTSKLGSLRLEPPFTEQEAMNPDSRAPGSVLSRGVTKPRRVTSSQRNGTLSSLIIGVEGSPGDVADRLDFGGFCGCRRGGESSASSSGSEDSAGP